MNAKFKGVGGAIGLTENEVALQRWLICGPEISRLLDEFEQIDKDDIKILDHHDSSVSAQSNFYKDVNNLLLTIDDIGNPFDDNSNDLFDLESRVVVPDNLVSNLYKIETVGTNQFNQFMENKIWKRFSPLSDTISRNKLYIFNPNKPTTMS